MKTLLVAVALITCSYCAPSHFQNLQGNLFRLQRTTATRIPFRPNYRGMHISHPKQETRLTITNNAPQLIQEPTLSVSNNAQQRITEPKLIASQSAPQSIGGQNIIITHNTQTQSSGIIPQSAPQPIGGQHIIITHNTQKPKPAIVSTTKVNSGTITPSPPKITEPPMSVSELTLPYGSAPQQTGSNQPMPSSNLPSQPGGQNFQQGPFNHQQQQTTNQPRQRHQQQVRVRDNPHGMGPYRNATNASASPRRRVTKPRPTTPRPGVQFGDCAKYQLYETLPRTKGYDYACIQIRAAIYCRYWKCPPTADLPCKSPRSVMGARCKHCPGTCIFRGDVIPVDPEIFESFDGANSCSCTNMGLQCTTIPPNNPQMFCSI